MAGARAGAQRCKQTYVTLTGQAGARANLAAEFPTAETTVRVVAIAASARNNAPFGEAKGDCDMMRAANITTEQGRAGDRWLF